MPQPELSSRPRFVLREEFVWIVCSVPGLEGLEVEIRRSLTNGEVEAIQRSIEELREAQQPKFDALHELAREADALAKSSDRAERARGAELTEDIDRQIEAHLAELHRHQLEAVAPLIRSWNVGTDDGEDAPPPVEAGLDAFRWVNRSVENWLVHDVLNGVLRPGKALTGSSTTSPPTPGPSPERKRRRSVRS